LARAPLALARPTIDTTHKPYRYRCAAIQPPHRHAAQTPAQREQHPIPQPLARRQHRRGREPKFAHNGHWDPSPEPRRCQVTKSRPGPCHDADATHRTPTPPTISDSPSPPSTPPTPMSQRHHIGLVLHPRSQPQPSHEPTHILESRGE
jgi:hypothetical protein